MVGKKAGRKGVSTAQRRRRAARAQGRDDRSDYKNVRRVEKVEAQNKKDGCLPKLFMLTLPVLVVGAIFIAIL